MGDDFRFWRLKDIERGQVVIGAIAAWWGDLRHSKTEPMDNEQARTRELSDTLLKFNNERLAAPGQAGREWQANGTAEPVVDLGPLEQRSGQWVKDALTAAIPNMPDTVRRWALDGTYYLCSQDDMAAIIQADFTDRKEYVPNRFDCEDFAGVFKWMVNEVYGLNQVGLVIDWSSGHGYNVIVFPDGEVWFFEPMNDQTVSIGAGIYKMALADILI